jgi:urate oxidase
MAGKLTFNTHGKGRVRLVKVIRHPDGRQDIIQMTVQILLEGDEMDSSFTEGNNTIIVPTDTCKNTVYCVASSHEFKSIEDFGLALCRHFLTEYPTIVNKINVTITKDIWQRMVLPDSNGRVAEHKHSFKRIGPQKPFTVVTGEKRYSSPLSLKVQSGFKNLEILKTTQSGFTNFHHCQFTSLPDSTDRLLGTAADAEWNYCPRLVMSGGIDYTKSYERIESTLLKTFAGPSDKGVYSPSVQETLYKMGREAIKAETSIGEITLYMPNIHNMTFPLENYGLKNKDHTGLPHIFFPIDEPHGMIKATISRNGNNGQQRSRM